MDPNTMGFPMCCNVSWECMLPYTNSERVQERFPRGSSVYTSAGPCAVPPFAEAPFRGTGSLIYSPSTVLGSMVRGGESLTRHSSYSYSYSYSVWANQQISTCCGLGKPASCLTSLNELNWRRCSLPEYRRYRYGDHGMHYHILLRQYSQNCYTYNTGRDSPTMCL